MSNAKSNTVNREEWAVWLETFRPEPIPRLGMFSRCIRSARLLVATFYDEETAKKEANKLNRWRMPYRMDKYIVRKER